MSESGAGDAEAASQVPLAGLRVLDFSEQIAGPYCSKLFVDAGADVIKVERPGGDTMRSWSATGGAVEEGGGALFRYLNAGKRSVVGRPTDAHVRALFAEADLAIEAHGLESDGPVQLDVEALRRDNPDLVVLSITPYGCTGPWQGRRATEFTLQAESGSIGMRGVMGREPYQAGGRVSEWGAGAFGAVAALPAVLRARAGGGGEHVDLSMLEVANLILTNNSETMNRLMNGSAADPEHTFLAPTVETPSIEATADGYVGFCTNSRQQFLDFLLLIERPDLQEDEELAQFAGRLMRFEEWNEIMRPWLERTTTAEAIERASMFRIPVAPIGNGRTVLEHEQLAARGVFGPDASGAALQPRRPYRIDDSEPPPPARAPRLDEHGPAPRFEGARPDGTPASRDPLPLRGLRILDVTAWWAGPAATHVLAALGAEVLHVESARRLDGVRMLGGMMAGHYPTWWEASPHFLQTNANKRGITLDLSRPRGREVLASLVERCDAMVENFTPRVLDGFGFTWEKIRELNPRAVLMRMPAFGLSGPWRDHTGFAQTMEQLSGLAWVTGHADDQPRIPRGPCDPIAGMHGAFALLAALVGRARSGRGHHVESTMVESALNVAAEQLVEWTAYGNLLEREGNRSPLAAPQGLYPCAGGQPGAEVWVAISVANDAQWRALVDALENPAWANEDALAHHAGRRAAHDAIDRRLRDWTRAHSCESVVEELRRRGIAASPVADPSRLLQENVQMRARGYFEAPQHAVVGCMPVASVPFRYAGVERWLRTPAPTVGEHNAPVLRDWLGLSRDALDGLQRDGVIGSQPEGL